MEGKVSNPAAWATAVSQDRRGPPAARRRRWWALRAGDRRRVAGAITLTISDGCRASRKTGDGAVDVWCGAREIGVSDPGQVSENTLWRADCTVAVEPVEPHHLPFLQVFNMRSTSALVSVLLAAVIPVAQSGAEYVDSPALADQVASGALPNLAQRLPQNPVRVTLDGNDLSPGRHGGELRLLVGREKDIRLMVGLRLRAPGRVQP